MLNRAGKLCLIKLVVSSIPVYEMQVAGIPSSVCTKIDQACRRFLWSADTNKKGWHLVGWDRVTTVRDARDLGIRDTRKANTALRGKLVWRLLQEPLSPWVRIYSCTYLKGTNIMDYQISGSASYSWRSIIRARDSLPPCFDFLLQQGNSSF